MAGEPRNGTMLFNSHVFLFAFLPLTLAVYFLLGRFERSTAAVAWLTVASLAFYGWWEPSNLILIGTSMLINFAAGRLLSLNGPKRAFRGLLLLLSVAFNLALLGYFKYTNFLVDNWNAAFGTALDVAPVILPLGISFFTFQQISYVIDAYRGETREHSVLHYCLFVSFFPQLIAGPIVHHGEMLPQFARETIFKPKRRHFEVGLTIFFIGLFKKVVIADGAAEHATPVFAAAAAGVPLTFLEAWCGAIAYTLQLYFDFSAYSDMAIGLARLFGVRLPLNFHSPYKAVNIIEFWRRWHMTLSRFLRDYLYIPLGGGRKGPVRRYVNLFITMLLGGFWHGAGWTFIAWGALHGVYLAVNHAWRSLQTGGSQAIAKVTRPLGFRAASTALTFLAVVAGWVLFRADSLSTAATMFHAMAGLNGMTFPIKFLPLAESVPGLTDLLRQQGIGFAKLPYFKGGSDLTFLLALLGVVWFAPNTQQIMRRFRPAYDTFTDETDRGPGWLLWRRNYRWAMAMSAVTVFSILHLSRISEFLYFQF